ncbi:MULTISPECIES: phage tail tape measure protein [unclassified Streptomyces]|uniref:phage tail tape measure protein n=1 Tax=unclassified Streptomyces TaxID=2593676 RepID=UPI002E197A36|nr:MULTISPECIES: phage tail tape measure protein [unclassified Streptomyces]
MALTVGELTGLITLDDRGMAPALRRTEGALRSTGQRMAGDADSAGQRAGQALGDGVVQGADGRLRNARGQFVAAGRRIGSSVGDGAADGAADGGERAAGALEGALGHVKGLLIGGAIGAALMTGLAQSLEQSQITGRLGAQLGATPAVAAQYGKIAGQMYAKGVTADFQTAADAISATMRAGIAPPGATNAQIESISTKVADLANTFELDLGQTANAVGQMIKTGLAKNGTEAVDALTAGLQKMGPRADDIADTFNEYSTIFRQMGISATDATGLLSQGMKAGARDTDVVADALKEFTLITQNGGKDVDAAFKKIGLSGKDMQEAFTKGGPEAKAALDKVFDGLRQIKDPAERNSIALALFKTKAEDTQKALFSLDPSKAASALGTVGGAADKMGNSLRDNAGMQVEAFKRQAMQKLVDFLGGVAIPAFMRLFGFVQQHSGTFKVIAAVITGVLVPAFILMGVNATVAATRTAIGWTTSGAAAVRSAGTQVAAAARTAGAWAMMAVRSAASFVTMAASATASAARTAAVWALSAARMAATWLVQIIRVAVTTAAQFVMMAARAVAWAAVMAAQWLIAMGPIGWIIAIVVALVALVIANWDKVRAWTLMAWTAVSNAVMAAVNWVLGAIEWLGSIPGKIGAWFGQAKDWAILKLAEMIIWLQGLPGRVGAAISGLLGTLRDWASRSFYAFYTMARDKVTSMIAWVRGLPGRIASAIGSLKDLLADKGRDLIYGLYNGVQRMGGWLKDKLIGFAKSMIPGPIAKALGIASPSKVMAKTVGRWIPAGIAQGVEANSGVLDKTMSSLVNTPSPSAAMAGAVGGAMAGAAGGGSTAVTLRVDTGGGTADRLLADLIRQFVSVHGGNVQSVLGKG